MHVEAGSGLSRSGSRTGHSYYNDDVFEPPLHPEIVVNTAECLPEECSEQVLAYLLAKGFVKPKC